MTLMRTLFLLGALVLLGQGCEPESLEDLGFEFRDPNLLDAGSRGDATADAGTPADADPDATDDDVPAPDVTPDGGPVDVGGDATPSTIACEQDSTCAVLLASAVGVCERAICADGTCALVDQQDGASCDDGDVCTSGDQCTAGACVGHSTDCDDGVACTDDGCNPADGLCFHVPLSGDDLPCDDGQACTEDDHCDDGVCQGTAKTCDDGEACTDDSCKADTGVCVHVGTAHEGDSCDDANACTSNETCQSGKCTGVQKVCADDDPCTADACNPADGSCSHQGVPGLNGLTCDDGDACTGGDRCQSGTCVGAPTVCDDGAGCLMAACDAQTGNCVAGDPKADGAPCDDGAACTTGDACQGGQCQGQSVVCDDGNSCTVDQCDPATGECAFAPAASMASCDDGDACTTGDGCDGSVCVGQPLVCDDGNPCTADQCDGGSCVAGPVVDGIPCATDADPCTTDGVCDAGACAGEAPRDCDDGDACTQDSCVAQTGECAHAAASDGAACDDGDACTGGDACVSGLCAGAALTCDDNDPCTQDACEPGTGCIQTVIVGCVTKRPPCNVNDGPGTSDAAVEACVCALDAGCCELGWDPTCVALATDQCGVACDCEAAGADLSCNNDTDCGFCQPDDLCEGAWRCVQGQCAQAEPVVCDTSQDVGCLSTACQPETGLCATVADVAACDDGLACTTDACHPVTGACESTPTDDCAENHPCRASAAPFSNDAEVSACVCAEEPGCCTSAWTAACAALAESACGVSCACDDLPKSGLTCAQSADCAFCEDDDLCNGTWACEDGACVAVAAPACDATGCQVASCDPQTGVCVVTGDAATCDDDNPCTQDSCTASNGTCESTPITGCGAQPPCKTSETPTSSDPEVTACVCALSPACCEGSWDQACVQLADSDCGAGCGCVATQPACSQNADCASCDDGDLCNGTWGCVDGTCAAIAPVTCDTSSDVGCLETACNPSSGQCEQAPVASACDDANACTTDACQADGSCAYTGDPNCAGHHPCKPSEGPESSDPGVTACVCALDPYCCAVAWDELCVQAAQDSCEASCDCDALGAEVLSCAADADCGFCDGGDVCDGAWKCLAGQCTQAKPVSCDTSGDAGCLVTTCQPATGACEATLTDALCDDDDPCTLDVCGDGGCLHLTVVGCAHPGELCQPSEGIAAGTGPVDSCACLIDPSCCEGAWGPGCVALAQSECGLVCDCDSAALECSVDADCATCDDADACNGRWVCQEGACVETEPVTCPEPGGCLVASCQPDSGECAALPDHASCADEDACTEDACGLDGLCTNEALAGCGPAHPCITSAAPGSLDAAVNACVCALDSSCCDGAWTAACVAIAIDSCSVSCEGCEEIALEQRGCVIDSNCFACEEDEDLCNGQWRCVDHVCQKTDPVVCDPSQDLGCIESRCDPLTGQCQLQTRSDLCADADLCTTDACHPETGVCANIPIEGCQTDTPCAPSPGPGTSDPSLEACVCALDPYCCEQFWDGLCAGTAVASCGLTCACEEQAPEDLACQLDAECTRCDADGDLCNGGWRCVEGVCTEQPGVECDPSNDVGCVSTQCQPDTGACVLTPADDSCSDGDPCTADVCDADTGACTSFPIPECSPHPDACFPAEAPGTSDSATESCVCEIDAFCCDVQWDGLCAQHATLFCGVTCQCEAFTDEQLSCNTVVDCYRCDDDADLCNGGYQCVDGLCTPSDAVTCEETGEEDCRDSFCDASVGACVMQPKPDACADPFLCTEDRCDLDTGACEAVAFEGCGPPQGDACESNEAPGLPSDPNVEACVCNFFPSCCSFAWDAVCAYMAQQSCGAACACPLFCSHDFECAPCEEPGCEGTATCVDGTCVPSDACP